MDVLETVVQECVDFVLPIISNVASSSEQILEKPLHKDDFPKELLEFHWPSLNFERAPGLDVDAIVGLTLKRIISELSSSEGDVDSDDLQSGIKQIAVVLDLSFHSRKNRNNPASWSTAFFSNLSYAIDSLIWPKGLLEFWPYAESRIEWFKMCNSLDPLVPGSSNLISYKQPLYDKLRHWNDLLRSVQNNYYLNTQPHYEMKFKFEKFLSEILPLYEESNFNRSALISSKQSSGNPWNKTISSATKTDPLSENVFATDYNYVFDELIASPLEFIYKPLEFKIDMDKVLTPLLDAVFEIEEDFYRRIKKSRKAVSAINEKLNHSFPIDFEIIQTEAPNYTKVSERSNNERCLYWSEFLKLDKSLTPTLRPTLLDISLSNPGVLYDQMLELDNDYYRKQFILQICFTANLIRMIIISPDVESYYKSCLQKERPSRTPNFQALNESNHKKTLSLCEYLIKNRTDKFYQHRDPQFANIVKRVLKSEESFLRAKVESFKNFQSFELSDDKIATPDVDYSYKKFGFVLFGNKSLSNVWKIKTGLDVIPHASKNAKDVYEDLRSKQQSEASDQHDATGSDDRIVKDWQILRSLRSQYLFDFNKVDESSGLNGLFEGDLSESRLDQRRKLLEQLVNKAREGHIQKLEAARLSMEEKMRKKRSLEEEKEQMASKKFKAAENEKSEFPKAADQAAGSEKSNDDSLSREETEKAPLTSHDSISDIRTIVETAPRAGDTDKKAVEEGNNVKNEHEDRSSTTLTVTDSSEQNLIANPSNSTKPST